MTTNTLLALVDGSAYSESVCRHAAWVADRSGWNVKLYHVLDQAEEADEQDLSGAIQLGARTALLEKLSELDAERAKLAHEHGRAILEDAKAIIEESGDITVETRLRRGELVETIAAKEEKGEMIVVGKRGKIAGQSMEHLGSNLESIVRASHKPVLIANRAFKQVNKILVAFDGAPTSQKAVEYIAGSPLFKGLEIMLVFVGNETPDIRSKLDKATATLNDSGLTSVSHIHDGEPEKVLSSLTTEGENGLLVMGAYGHSRIRSFIIGSTSTEMIRSCRIPILIMR